ncbi:MAG: hypothetical protein AB4426_23565 [Xenococcaceae cyanobacterium]
MQLSYRGAKYQNSNLISEINKKWSIWSLSRSNLVQASSDYAPSTHSERSTQISRYQLSSFIYSPIKIAAENQSDRPSTQTQTGVE